VTFLKANYSFKDSKYMSMARVLMSLDLRSGLYETINIDRGFKRL